MIDRRGFLQAAGGVGAGLIIGFCVRPRGSRAAEPAVTGASPATAATWQANAFLRIGRDDSVTVILAHSEMGQGIWTTLPMLIAEELGCDWSRIRCEHAPAAPAYRHTAFPIQMTGGSTTTWSEFDRYRQAGAVAREMLIAAAAKQWGVAAKGCRAEGGLVKHGDKQLGFGALAAAAEKLTPPAKVELKPPAKWMLIGHPTKRLDSAEKVTGKAQFGMDVQLPGLMTAVVARSPVFGGHVKSHDATKALLVPGVKAVVPVSSGVAVVAENFWAARLGRDALTVEWDLGAGAALDTEKMREEYRALAATPGLKAAAAGDAAAALGKAAKVLEAEYELPYLAHATMEPLNCTVRADKDRCEIWTGTQFQTADQMAAARVFGLLPPQVEIHTTFLGGGFGRRATPSAHVVFEACEVAKASGMPVKVVWTREDDMRGGYYRPMWFHRLRAGLDAKGQPAAWDQTIVGQSILEGTPFAMMVKDGIDESSVEGAFDSPYVKGLAHHRVELHSVKSPVPVLWWRSVGHSHTAFAMESFIDELAHAAGVDPLEYRRGLLKDHPRHLATLNLAAEKAGWGSAPAGGGGRGRGLAVHESFGSFIAFVVDVSVDGAAIRVHRAVAAVDCGVCVNPAGVAAQLEGATAFALSAALHGELTFKEGRIQQSNFHDYRLLRIPAMPAVEVHIVPSSEKPGGIGEPGVPPVAPAVGNAVFAATGKRLRRLPFHLAALAIVALGLGVGLAGCRGQGRVSEKEGLAAFETVRAVLQHPRCQNCHIPGDAPLQFDEGMAHGQDIMRGPDGVGAPGFFCSTCHAAANPPDSYGPHMPPGAPNWRLPPPATRMVFIGLSSGQLCRGVKDEKQNGGRDLRSLVEHVAHDGLVLWGWRPGLGRAPVSVPHAEFVAKFKQWVAAGAPCPAS